MIAAQNRTDYFKEQKEKFGRKVFGIFPIYYPGEILTAFDILPAEIWDPPKMKPASGEGKLQPFICSIVKVGLEFIIQGKASICDGFILPHTCDSLQNAGSIVKDFIKVDKPAFYFYHPKIGSRESAKEFYYNECKSLISSLEKLYGKLSEENLFNAVKLHNKANGLKAKLMELKGGNLLNCTDAEFYNLIRQGEYLYITDYIQNLEDFIENKVLNSPKDNKIPILISGIIAHPPEFLSILESCGAYVAADDLANTGRKIVPKANEEGDLIKNITEQYFNSPPCPTKCHPQKERLDYLVEKIKNSGARGVIFYNVKFCEPESYDYPFLASSLKEMNIPTLELETEINDAPVEQMRTRVEAFIEMIS